MGRTECDTLTFRSGGALGELDGGGEGSKGYRLAVIAIALLEILDDELGAGLAERASGDIGEGLGYLLAGRQVLQRRRAASQGGCDDRHLDRIALGDGDAGEVSCAESVCRSSLRHVSDKSS